MDYYPEAQQFITILRDPLEAAISNYFFWKTKARAIQLKNGLITQGGEHDYKNIDDFFHKRPRSNMLDFMPRQVTRENYKKIIATHFVWIGLVDNLQLHIHELIRLLDLPSIRTVHVSRVNSSPRDEILAPHIRETFMAENQLEFEIYQYIKEILIQEGQP